jgi:hypothetical protein
MPNQMYIAEALSWLEDCFEDLPADLTEAEIVAGVKRHFDGGWLAFVEAVS